MLAITQVIRVGLAFARAAVWVACTPSTAPAPVLPGAVAL